MLISTRIKLMGLVMGFYLLTGQLNAQGTWTPVTRPAPDPNNGVMLQMSDGSVICHTTDGAVPGKRALGDGTIWNKLTPDSTGSYANGTWDTIGHMNQERFSFSSAVLKDGRVYAAGGEYGTDGTQAGYHGEVYNPATNTWTEISGSTAAKVISDGSCKILDDGSILQGLVDVSFPVHTVFFTPSTNAYTAGPSSLHGSNESMWLKLPDNSILFVDEDAQTSERYIPSTNTWIADASVPVALYDPYGYECGPAWMLPNGKAFFIGGTNKTAIYTPSGTTAPGTWVAGPDVPNGYGMPDAPGVMMVNGNILFACSPQPTQQNEFASPTAFYEYNYLTNAFTAVSAPSTASTNAVCQNYCLLGLANGQVLCGLAQATTQQSEQYFLYNPTGTQLAAGQPVITGVTRLTCTTAMVTGHGFNGISEGSAFGDENECDSNYPLFRFTKGGKVYYARSYNWNSTGVQRGLKPDTAYITLPNSMVAGSYYMYCVANGIASDSILFVDSTASLSSTLTPPSICTGSAFTYVATSSTSGATYTWIRPAVTGISNAAITTPQSTNPNEVLTNTTAAPVTVVYDYSVSGAGCTNDESVSVVVNPAPVANFTAFPTTSCSLPDSVAFTNTTIAGTTYTWYFGDNNTSTATSPVHSYTTAASYSVKLVAKSACGADSITQANLIVISPPAAPVAASPVSVSCGATATLTATGSDTLKWFNQPTGGAILGTGTSYTTGSISGNTTYYVENYSPSSSSYCPPLTDGIGGGGNFANTNYHGEIFNVNQACTLASVLVYSTGAGNRTITLMDANNNVLQTTVANIPNGASRVTLNYPLAVGTGYQIGCGDGITTTNLYRNNAGVAFPYTDPAGFVTITGNDIVPSDPAYYYYFYDWQLEGAPCVSSRTPVAVNVTNGLNITSNITGVACNGGANGSAALTPTGGTPAYSYTWSNGETTATLTGASATTYTVTVHDASGCSGTASESITQPTAINVSVTTTGASCGSSTGTATAAVSGGTATYSYFWSNAETTVTATGLAPNTYTLTVTDAHSCTATGQAVIVNSGNLTVVATGTGATCNGASTGSASVTVNGSVGTITYNWSNGGSTNPITNIPAGSYNITVSDAGGCSGTSGTTVSQPTALNVSVTATNSGCGAPNGSAVASVTGGTSGYTYLWSNAATTTIISGLSAASYNLTVTDANLCTATSSATIANSGQLNISTTTTATSCTGGATGSATAAVNGGTSPFTYAWSDGNTTASITGVNAATYQITISDNAGCTGTASAVVSAGTALSITTALTNLLCFNDVNGVASVSVISGTSPYQYAWSNGSNTDTITGLAAGSYYVTATDARNCQTIDSAVIQQPSSITIFINAVQPTCSGLTNGNAQVHATGGTPGYNYLWSTGSISLGLGNLAPDGYSVTLTDANGCTAMSTFTITNPPPVTATVNAINDSCYGSSDGNIQITPVGGTGPYSYLWSNNSTAAELTNLAAGNYIVTITDVHNCSGTDTTGITQPAQITITTSATETPGGQSTGSASVSNVTGGISPYLATWSNGLTGNTISGLAAGTYTVTVTDHNGCQSTATATVSNSVGIISVNGDLSFTIYPNPAKSEVTIDAGTLDKETTLVLEDILGQALMAKEVTVTPVTIDISNYANGVYFVELRQGSKRSVKKLVINK
jgi:PKD repeat protein